ncbi:MAG: SDR family oxidoreductase [Verrucomicrobiota bacterium]
MKIDLSDKTILMTGALGGIADSVVQVLTASGATIIATDKQPTALVHPYFSMDVTDHAAVDRVVAAAFAQYPGINIALGHAGGTGVFPFETCERERFDKIFAFNFTGQTYFARAVLREWRQRHIAGHLIFTSSFVSRIPMAGISAYVAAKAALEMFAKNLALEYAPHKIRVNCIAPGNVAVGSSKAIYETDPVYRAWVDRVSPLGQRNSPAGIAHAFLYLCSPLADELDGHVLQVDMGVGLPKLG